MAAWALGAAALLLMMAHEPALVLLGRRGARRRERSAAAAGRWLGLELAAAFALGGFALSTGPPRLWLAVAATLPLAGATLAAVLLGRERTTTGELIAAGALTSAAVPVAAAAGLELADACILWALWAMFFGSLTLSVRGVLAAARKRRPSRRLLWWGVAAALAADALLLVASGNPALAAAFAPVCFVTAALAVWPPAPQRLKAVGLASAGAALITCTALVLLSMAP